MTFFTVRFLHAATSAPTIASIREETVKSVSIALEEPAEGSKCVEDYIIQYEGRSVSTGGNLSVVIEDVLFCRVAPVTFSVTAVLGDGSVISGSESADFNVTGESKQIILLHACSLLFIYMYKANKSSFCHHSWHYTVVGNGTLQIVS